MTTTEITLLAAGSIAVVAYVALILVPAWTSYGRMWERAAASFLTLYIVAALAGIGAGIGAAIVYLYDRM